MRRRTIVASLALLALAPLAAAYNVTDKLSVNAVLAGAGQCQRLSEDAGFDDECEGALSVGPEISLRPTDNDGLFMKFGFATGNGLNTNAEEGRLRSPFALVTWAADLEDDVENINGRSRDYLLTAWYKHTFEFRNDRTLGATLGIIDSTDYLDENAYANDEYTQFMNEVFVNGNQDLDKTQVAEIYYRLVMGDHVAPTADIQYMKDEMKEGGDDPEGWILGLRATGNFLTIPLGSTAPVYPIVVRFAHTI